MLRPCQSVEAQSIGIVAQEQQPECRPKRPILRPSGDLHRQYTQWLGSIWVPDLPTGGDARLHLSIMYDASCLPARTGARTLRILGNMEPFLPHFQPCNATVELVVALFFFDNAWRETRNEQAVEKRLDRLDSSSHCTLRVRRRCGRLQITTHPSLDQIHVKKPRPAAYAHGSSCIKPDVMLGFVIMASDFSTLNGWRAAPT